MRSTKMPKPSSKPVIDTKRQTPDYDSNKPNPKPIKSPNHGK